jgi:IS5 family transposase
MRNRYLRPSRDLPEIYLYRTPIDFRKQANGLEPSAYIHHVLESIAEADTVEKLEALLPWNAELPASKKVDQHR